MLHRVGSKVATLLEPIVSAVRLARWRRGHEHFLAIFNWHQVTPKFDPIVHHKFTWTSLGRFKREITYLAERFQILPLHEAIDRLKRGSLRGGCVSLTFDDGDISVAEHVLPVLQERGLPATFFINSAYLDGRRTYWVPILSALMAVEAVEQRCILPAGLKENALALRQTTDSVFYNAVRLRLEEFGPMIPKLGSRLVSAEWLSGLDHDQFAIGAHGHEHQRFSLMPAEWQRNDLRENVQALAQFRAYRPIFAVPFGRPHDWTQETLRIAREQELEVVLADGGINLAAGEVYRRMPSDDKKVRGLLAAAVYERLETTG